MVHFARVDPNVKGNLLYDSGRNQHRIESVDRKIYSFGLFSKKTLQDLKFGIKVTADSIQSTSNSNVKAIAPENKPHYKSTGVTESKSVIPATAKASDAEDPDNRNADNYKVYKDKPDILRTGEKDFWYFVRQSWAPCGTGKYLRVFYERQSRHLRVIWNCPVCCGNCCESSKGSDAIMSNPSKSNSNPENHADGQNHNSTASASTSPEMKKPFTRNKNIEGKVTGSTEWTLWSGSVRGFFLMINLIALFAWLFALAVYWLFLFLRKKKTRIDTILLKGVYSNDEIKKRNDNDSTLPQVGSRNQNVDKDGTVIARGSNSNTSPNFLLPNRRQSGRNLILAATGNKIDNSGNPASPGLDKTATNESSKKTDDNLAKNNTVATPGVDPRTTIQDARGTINDIWPNINKTASAQGNSPMKMLDENTEKKSNKESSSNPNSAQVIDNVSPMPGSPTQNKQFMPSANYLMPSTGTNLNAPGLPNQDSAPKTSAFQYPENMSELQSPKTYTIGGHFHTGNTSHLSLGSFQVGNYKPFPPGARIPNLSHNSELFSNLNEFSQKSEQNNLNLNPPMIAIQQASPLNANLANSHPTAVTAVSGPSLVPTNASSDPQAINPNLLMTNNPATFSMTGDRIPSIMAGVSYPRNFGALSRTETKELSHVPAFEFESGYELLESQIDGMNIRTGNVNNAASDRNSSATSNKNLSGSIPGFLNNSNSQKSVLSKRSDKSNSSNLILPKKELSDVGKIIEEDDSTNNHTEHFTINSGAELDMKASKRMGISENTVTGTGLKRSVSMETESSSRSYPDMNVHTKDIKYDDEKSENSQIAHLEKVHIGHSIPDSLSDGEGIHSEFPSHLPHLNADIKDKMPTTSIFVIDEHTDEVIEENRVHVDSNEKACEKDSKNTNKSSSIGDSHPLKNISNNHALNIIPASTLESKALKNLEGNKSVNDNMQEPNLLSLNQDPTALGSSAGRNNRSLVSDNPKTEFSGLFFQSKEDMLSPKNAGKTVSPKTGARKFNIASEPNSAQDDDIKTEQCCICMH